MARSDSVYLEQWADTGAKTDPGAAKVNLGFVAEIPTFQMLNWWMNRCDELLHQIETYGIMEWSSVTNYADGALCRASDGLIYIGQQAFSVNHDPVSAGVAWWRPASAYGEWDSGIVAIASGTTVTVAHGLGAVPSRFEAYFVCNTIDGGYQVGDVITSNVGDPGANGAIDKGVVVAFDSVNMKLICGADGNLMSVLDKALRTFVHIAYAKWDIQVRASI